MHTAIHRYRAGMPQLAHTGLAENWLLKECGQRHWDALAAYSGRDAPEFFDDDGRRAYASFVAVHVDMSRRHAIRENDTFALHVALHRSARFVTLANSGSGMATTKQASCG
jgi:probable biosynthetic protein (TIGR04099 family)